MRRLSMHPLLLRSLRYSALALACTAGHGLAQTTPDLLQLYCTGCHNFEDWAGSLNMEELNFDDVEHNAETWELIIRKLNAGMMPPKGEKQPQPAAITGFIAELEGRLDSSVQPLAAAPGLHRLNRSEYRNAIRDLFDLDVNVAAMLPSDDATEGFDNVAAGLAISPAQHQRPQEDQSCRRRRHDSNRKCRHLPCARQFATGPAYRRHAFGYPRRFAC